ncbi:MAG: hypothetical protein AAFV95_21695 [Bacteroidota bacterium]
MFKFLNRALFESEKRQHMHNSVRYGSYSELIEDIRIVSGRKGSELKGKSFASTSEDPVLARLIDANAQKEQQ